MTRMTTLPKWSPEANRRNAARPSAIGNVESIGTRSRPEPSSRTIASNSWSFPIVEPITVHWFQNSLRASVSSAGPDVAPHVTRRPPRPSAPSERAHVACPTLSSTTFDASFRGARPDLRGDVRGAMIEAHVRAQRRGAFQLRVAAGGRPYARAQGLRDAECRERNPSANPPDQDVLVRHDAGARDQHAPRGESDEPARRCFVERHVGTQPPNVRAGNDNKLGDGAAYVLSQQAEPRTQRVLAGPTVLASAIAQAGIDDDAIAYRNVAHLCAHSVDNARSIRSQHPRRRYRDAGKTFDDEQIEMIQRSRVDAHAHASRIDQRRVREVCAVTYLLQSAVRVNRECSQRVRSLLYWRLLKDIT